MCSRSCFHEFAMKLTFRKLIDVFRCAADCDHKKKLNFFLPWVHLREIFEPLYVIQKFTIIFIELNTLIANLVTRTWCRGHIAVREVKNESCNCYTNYDLIWVPTVYGGNVQNRTGKNNTFHCCFECKRSSSRVPGLHRNINLMTSVTMTHVQGHRSNDKNTELYVVLLKVSWQCSCLLSVILSS